MNLLKTPIQSVLVAEGFARAAHGLQERKGGGLYIHHPIEVAELLYSTGFGEHVIIAGLLHDVLEDTKTEYTTIYAHFGEYVAELVLEVTDPPKQDGENRKTRKAKVRERYKTASFEAKSIKLADIISNTRDLDSLGDFAPRFVEEKKALLEVLHDGHPRLFELASLNVQNYYNKCS